MLRGNICKRKLLSFQERISIIEFNNIIITRAILHVLDVNIGRSELSDYDIEMGSNLHDLLWYLVEWSALWKEKSDIFWEMSYD